MAMSSWMKYLGLASAFAGVGTRIFAWLRTAQSVGSPGGDDIHPSEVVQLEGVITDAVNQGLQAAEVPIVAQVTLTYVGD